jgi:Tfp pilus assembly PilM family ATPase
MFHERIEIPVEIANPLSRLSVPGNVADPDLLRELAPALGVAVGLGLRERGGA